MRFLILFLCLPLTTFSQRTINAEQFFAFGLSEHQVTSSPNYGDVNFPWIDRYEFRTETNDFELDKQEYLIRLTPSTGKIRNAQKALYRQMVNAPDIDGQEMYCDHKLALHLDWLSLHINKENQALLDELVIILNDKLSIYEKKVGTLEFNPEDLVNLYTEKSDIEIALNKLQLKWDYLLDKYNLQNYVINFGEFISIETISRLLAENMLSINESEMVDQKTEYRKQLLQKEIELEASEKKRIFDFLQLKYSGPNSDPFQERVSLGVGFQLSNSGSKKLKMQELKLEQDALNRKAERETEKKKTKLNTTETKLQNDIKAFSHFQKTIEEERSELKKLSNSISRKEGTSPLFLLNIEERHLKMKMKSLNKTEDLLKEYLKYLQESGVMCQGETVNYLNQ